MAIASMKRFFSLLAVFYLAVVMPLQAAEKRLPLKGKVFLVQEHTAFLILPDKPKAGKPIPWVWYAPTLRGLPASSEKWMFERFLNAGIAIAGVDVGESYGSPKGRAVYSALHEHLVKKRGLEKQACLLARSRGGLMLYCWAAENPDKVKCITGIYPVCNIASYPGLKRACGAYGLTANQLESQLTKHNPIDRLELLAKAKVPIFHIHGDQDRVVPLDKNSAIVKERYGKLGGLMTLEVAKGQGHNMWVGWFQSQNLVDFVIKHATKRGETNKSSGRSTIEKHKNQIVYLDLQFTRDGKAPVLMGLYVFTDTKRKPHIVLFFHGGLWRSGSKKTCHVHWLTQHGYAVASVGYRLTQIAPFPTLLHDCKGAVRFLRANADKYHVDGGKMGASGASAGGHLALLLATSGDVKELEGNVGGNLNQSSKVQFGLGLFCPTDLLYDAVENKAWFDNPGSSIYQLLGCKPSENLDKAKMASATGHITKDDPPILILAGDADKEEPRIHGKRMKAAYDRAGLEATFQIVEGAGHGGPQYHDAKRKKLILGLLARELRGE